MPIGTPTPPTTTPTTTPPSARRTWRRCWSWRRTASGGLKLLQARCSAPSPRRCSGSTTRTAADPINKMFEVDAGHRVPAAHRTSTRPMGFLRDIVKMPRQLRVQPRPSSIGGTSRSTSRIVVGRRRRARGDAPRSSSGKYFGDLGARQSYECGRSLTEPRAEGPADLPHPLAQPHAIRGSAVAFRGPAFVAGRQQGHADPGRRISVDRLLRQSSELYRQLFLEERKVDGAVPLLPGRTPIPYLLMVFARVRKNAEDLAYVRDQHPQHVRGA